MRDIKNILIGILAVLALLQFIQYGTHFIRVKPLAGVVAEKSWPGFSLETVSNQQFQDYIADHTGYNFGFRPDFVRINNQLYFSLFRQSPYPNLVIGKDNYLYERPYIESYYGENFLGEESIDSSLMKLNAVRSFMRENGTEIIVVIAPNKADYFNEYIPGYLVENKRTSNYDYYRKRLEEGGYHVLDANAWFKAMKPVHEYPMMSRSGIHWSVYGSAYLADSLVGFMEQVLDRRLVRFTIDSVEYPQVSLMTDKDLRDLANVFTTDKRRTYAYPVAFSHLPNPDGYKPDIVVIGDSFFWTLYQGYLTNCLGDISFWYYFHLIYPQVAEKNVTTAEIDVLQHALDSDIVLLVTSTDNLKDFGFGFIEHMYSKLPVAQ